MKAYPGRLLWAASEPWPLSALTALGLHQFHKAISSTLGGFWRKAPACLPSYSKPSGPRKYPATAAR